jgi:hypothetical protein
MRKKKLLPLSLMVVINELLVLDTEIWYVDRP